jgi:hypothetical protein
VSAVHALALPLALLVTVCLPVVVAALICADEPPARLRRRIVTRRAGKGRWRQLRQLDRALRLGPTRLVDQAAWPGRRDGPSIEQLAAELRRLGERRRQLAGRPHPGRDALLAAYDDRLRLASRRLGVAEYLADLEGLDREIERVRVEGALEAAGLVLRTPHADPRRPAG